jgi:alpha/beta hydrolase fold.
MTFDPDGPAPFTPRPVPEWSAPEPPPPEPSPAEPRRPWRLGIAVRVVALLGALALLAYGLTTAQDGRAHEKTATRALARSRGRLARTREQERIARSDLAAAQAAIADFTLAAQGATDASTHLIDVEGALTDRLARLRAAGSSGDFGTYNRLVDVLNGGVDALKAAGENLNVPFESLSKSLSGLPTARCAGRTTTPTDFVAYGSSGLRCARVVVPLDYSRPNGKTIDLTVVMRPADNPTESHGPLVLNPGGPGGSAIAFLREASLLLPSDVLRQFDLVGLDPRGVGQSTPVDCADSLDPLFDNDLTSSQASVRAAALGREQKLIQQCQVRSGDLLPYVDTTSAARDIDRVRVALHKDQISFLGFSYGTYLGAVYADLFPTRIRAAVLDGAVDPERARRTVSLSSGGSDFEEALNAALLDCAANVACSFNNHGDPGKAYDALMTSLTLKPLDVGSRKMGRGLAELGVVSVLYEGRDGWNLLTDALTHAALGDGAPLLALSDGYAGRRKDGSYNNELEAHYAINCIELANRPSPHDAQQRLRDLGHLNRFDAVDLMLSLPCAFWPVPPVKQPRTIHGKGAAPILVVGNAGDPVTPIEDAEALTKALDSAVLLRWEGAGHTVVGRGVKCIDDAVTAYLVDLTVPAAGTSCPA